MGCCRFVAYASLGDNFEISPLVRRALLWSSINGGCVAGTIHRFSFLLASEGAEFLEVVSFDCGSPFLYLGQRVSGPEKP